MKRLFIGLLGAIAAAALALPAAAQQPPAGPPPAPVRGTVKSLDGTTLVVASLPSGSPSPPLLITTVMLADNWTLTVLKRVDVGQIQPGSFIGTTNVDLPGGGGQSTEIHVFPPGQRGGEGHYPMPGQNAMMTNGDVTMIATGAKGRELDIKYNGRGGSGVRHVVVPPGTPIVMFSPGDHAALKAGAQVLVFAAKGQDGVLHAMGVLTSADGGPLPF